MLLVLDIFGREDFLGVGMGNNFEILGFITSFSNIWSR